MRVLRTRWNVLHLTSRTRRPLLGRLEREEISTSGRHVAEFGRRSGEKNLRENRVVAQYSGVVSDVGVASESSNDQASCGVGLDVIERKTVDVDDLAGDARRSAS
jgi:hypothetical protein